MKSLYPLGQPQKALGHEPQIDLCVAHQATTRLASDLADAATKIVVELRNLYVLGYRPKDTLRDGKWHKIKVKLLPPKGFSALQVHARQGYYASE